VPGRQPIPPAHLLASARRCLRRAAGILPVALLAAGSASAYFGAGGAGSASALVGTLSAPAIASTSAGAGTVTLTWSRVSPPSGTTAIRYYVTRNGATPSGTCPPPANPSAATGCTDTGLTAGTYTYTVTAVWQSWASASAAAQVSVSSGPLDHFSLLAASPTTAGSPLSVTVTARDAAGNPVVAYRGTVHFTSSDQQAVLPPDYAFTTSDAGTHTFTAGATLKTAGSQTITVADTTQPSAAGSASVTVDPAAAAAFSVSAATTMPTAGTPDRLTITALDPYGNTATGYAGAQTISFSGPSSSPNGTPPSYPASVSFTAGTATPQVTLYDAQTTKLTASQGRITGTIPNLTVAAAAASRLGFTSSPVSGPSSATANLGPITVQTQDQYGNPQTAGGATALTLASSSATGVFSSTQFGPGLSSVSIPSGQTSASFYYGDRTAGTPTLTVSAGGLGSATQAETVTASAPAGLGIVLAGGTGTPSLACGPVAATNTCKLTGVGADGQAVFYVTFLDANGSPTIYSSTDPSTVAETGHNSGSVTIAADASSSAPDTLAAGHTANPPATSTLSFGPYKLTVRVSS
jgi:hypothetical protein